MVIVFVNVLSEGSTLMCLFFVPPQAENPFLTTVVNCTHGILTEALTGKSLLALINW